MLVACLCVVCVFANVFYCVWITCVDTVVDRVHLMNVEHIDSLKYFKESMVEQHLVLMYISCLQTVAMYEYVSVCQHLHVCLSLCKCVCVCLCLSLCKWVCVCVCVSV